MAALELTSSMYLAVPIAPVESDGAAVVSRCPAQFRRNEGASLAAVGGDARPASRAEAASAVAFSAVYAAGSGTLSGIVPAARGVIPAGAGRLSWSTNPVRAQACGPPLAQAAPAGTAAPSAAMTRADAPATARADLSARFPRVVMDACLR